VLQALGIVVLLAMLGALIGWWFAGLFFIVLALLLILALARLSIG
jgi:hypothetical protein